MAKYQRRRIGAFEDDTVRHEEEARERFLERISQDVAKLRQGNAKPSATQMQTPANPGPPGGLIDHDHSRTGFGGPTLGDPTKLITGRGQWAWDISGKLGINVANPQNRLHVKGPNAATTTGRPASDISITRWFNEDGVSQTNLWDEINDSSPDDESSYILSQQTSANQIYETKLTAVPIPGAVSGCSVTVRMRRENVSAQGSNLVVSLIQGGIGGTIATHTYSVQTDLTTSYVNFIINLTPTEAGSITDGADLRIQFNHGPFGGSPDLIRVTQAFFTIPPSGPGEEVVVKVQGGSGQTLDWLQLLLFSGATFGLKLPGGLASHSWTVPAAQGAANSFLKNDGSGNLSWDTAPGSHNLLSATHPDTLAASVSRGDLIVGNATPKWSRFAIGATGRFLRSDGTDPSWQLLAVGDIPAHNLLSATHGDTVAQAAAKGKLIVGKTTGPSWDGLTVGTDGQVLTADSAQTLGVKWATPAAGSNALLDGSNHTDTVAQAVSRGSLIYGNSTPKWDELVVGSARQLLRTDGTDVAWASRSKGVIWLPPTLWLQSNGTSATISAVTAGSYPETYEQWTWVDAPASSPQGFTTQFVVPQDYVSGTALEIYLHWTEPTANLGDLAWVFRYHFKALTQTGGTGTGIAGSWTTTSDTLVDNGATGSGGDYDYGVANKYAVTRIATDLPSTDLAVGKTVLLAVDRLSTDAADNLNKSVRFLGLELRYTRDI